MMLLLSYVIIRSYMTYQKMLAVVAQCELTMVKSVQVHRMNVREQENYTKLNSEIGN